MAFDAFLKIEGIDGESTDDKHKDWIDTLSFSWGVDRPPSSASSGGGSAAKRATFQPFVITKRIDKASPKLMLACASGQHLPQAILDIRRAGGDKPPFINYTLTDVRVTALQPSGSSNGEDLPLEEVSLNYGKIKWEYTRLDEQGKPVETISGGWDLKKNKQV